MCWQGNDYQLYHSVSIICTDQPFLPKFKQRYCVSGQSAVVVVFFFLKDTIVTVHSSARCLFAHTSDKKVIQQAMAKKQ